MAFKAIRQLLGEIFKSDSSLIKRWCGESSGYVKRTRIPVPTSRWLLWWKAAAVLHMAAPAISRQESPYRRLVSNASVLFEQMADMIDFICTNQPSVTQLA